eukprot:m.138902 g.138902  ORF g.138902 m.138902 type:complete len:88 (-) comp14929_c0_seq1:650-913(-)
MGLQVGCVRCFRLGQFKSVSHNLKASHSEISGFELMKITIHCFPPLLEEIFDGIFVDTLCFSVLFAVTVFFSTSLQMKHLFSFQFFN